MDLAPRNPGFEAVVRASFARQGMMRLISAEIAALGPGRCTLSAPIRPETSQQHGYAHAGLAWTLGDSAAGYSALSLLGPGEEVLTVEMKINLMAPARGDRLVAEGRVIRAGRRLLTVGAEIHAEDGAARRHVATMLGTMFALTAGTA
jgi:uncharacterized protein (TIGR00369 family)